MKLYIMKRDALELLKENLPVVYGKYYTEATNDWIADICGENPFIEFRDIPEFQLASLDSDYTPGEIDLFNCKILYEKLAFLSESQSSDERLWAGLCNSTFYGYMRKRWKYGYGARPQKADKEASRIQTRFFFKGTGRTAFYRNTLAKCWWVGHNTYDPNNNTNHFERLDIIGSNDLNSKISEFFHNYTFSSNPYVMDALIESLRRFNEEGRKLLVRDHIRPALQYLNAVGGSVVIDCLSQDDITDIFSDAISALLQGDTPSLSLSNYTDDITDEVDYSDESSSEGFVEELSVILGCVVTIRNEDGDVKHYKYDYYKGDLPDKLKAFSGHKINDLVIIDDEEWRIVDISL